MKLIKSSKFKYTFVDDITNQTVTDNIDSIAELMMGLGVAEEEIDLALQYMALLGHNRAMFGDRYGMFMYTEKAA